jgi:hypothetical protein
LNTNKMLIRVDVRLLNTTAENTTDNNAANCEFQKVNCRYNPNLKASQMLQSGYAFIALKDLNAKLQPPNCSILCLLQISLDSAYEL